MVYYMEGSTPDGPVTKMPHLYYLYVDIYDNTIRTKEIKAISKNWISQFYWAVTEFSMH